MKEFTIKPVPPFRLDLTAWVLRRVPNNQIDRWDGRTYSRTLILGGVPVEASVVQTAPPERPELTVTLAVDQASEAEAAETLTKLLGLEIDLSGFYELAAPDARLCSLAKPFRGFRPPMMPSVFEALLNGIACQQISLVVGITLLNRLSQAFGLAWTANHAFPRPEDLAGASVDQVRGLGFSGRKAENILSISRAVVSGELDLEALKQMETEVAVSALCRIHGIGRWTAEYVALRGLGRLDIYPADDIGSQNRLQRWLGLETRPDYEGVHLLVDKWTPYRGLIYFHLLMQGQAETGLVQVSHKEPSTS